MNLTGGVATLAHVQPLTPLPGAQCVGTNPTLFDAITWTMAEPALDVCARCRVQMACERMVLGPRPRRSLYDGVAGGRVWRDGAPVPRPAQWRYPKLRDTCGTLTGRRDHESRDERHCLACERAALPVYEQTKLV